MRKTIYLCLAVLVGLSMASESFAQGKKRGGQRAVYAPIALSDSVATLSPENSKVSFVGTHVGDDPKPRFGGFKKFSGQLVTTADGQGIDSLTMEFETGSLYTKLGRILALHLKNADFLDVKNHPSAKFVSTGVTAGEDGVFNVVGDFTLMGKTNSITIPLKVISSDEGIMAKSELELDRTSFGMNNKLEQVSKEVSITLEIGLPTTKTRGKGPAGEKGKAKKGKAKAEKAKASEVPRVEQTLPAADQ